MDLNDTPQQAEYRAKVRTWLQEHAKEAPPVRAEGDEDAYLQARRASRLEPLTALREE